MRTDCPGGETGDDVSTAWTLILTTLAAAGLVMTAAAAWSYRRRRYAVVDVAWGAAFAVTAVAAAVTAMLVGAPGGLRRWLLVGLVGVWGLRLARHLWSRVVRSAHDDPRYEQLLGGPFREVPFATVVRKVFLLQGLAVALVSAPVVVGLGTETHWWWAVALGVVLWAAGLIFEAVGDAQLASYKRDPDRRPVLDTGLWAWSRHPNYFGDACVWWGLWLVGGVGAGWIAGLATLPAPIVMTWFLAVATGARPTERRMEGRPGWDVYAARTPMFLPHPPQSRAQRRRTSS